MKTIKIRVLLSIAFCQVLMSLSLHAQTSQVIYNSNGTSGSLTLSANDCTSQWWYYDWVITVPVNTPIKVTTELNYEAYLDVYTYSSGMWEFPFSGDQPATTTATIITTNGSIYVYCEDWYGINPTSPVFTITFEVDSTIYSQTNDLHVPGKLSVASGLNVFGNTNLQGNTRINSRLGIGESPYDSKMYVYNYNQDNYAIRSYSYKTSTSSTHGLYSSATNNTGNVYGIYSTVSGVAGKKWAGYFNGGDVAIMGGNTGIGVNDPKGILQVRGTYDNSWIYFSPNAGMSTTTKYKPKVNYGLAFTWNYSGGDGESIINYSGELASSRLDFTSFNGTDLTTEMTLKGGSLGIGTISPTEKLTIAGGHGDTKIRLHSIGNGSDQPANLSLWASEPGLTYYGTGIGYNVNGSPHYGRIDNTRGSSYIRFLPGETKFMFQTTTSIDVDALTIKDDGKVGIGTSLIPADYKLAVAGNIIAEEVVVKVQSNWWPDYVFHQDYSLKPLHEVEQFVRTNKHLPGIPSAAQVEEKGLSMGEMQNKLLQKVEELTLYIIEQDKKIKLLEEKLK